MASVPETLRAILGDDPDLAAIVGDRIYPGQVPADEDPTPWLYYALPETVPFDELGGVDTVRHQAEFHALADRYATAAAIVARVRALLSGYQGGGIVESFWAGTAEEVTEDGYHHVSRFDVTAFVGEVLTPPPPPPPALLFGLGAYGITFPIA